MTYPSFFSRLYETAQAFRDVTESIKNNIYPHNERDRKNRLIVGECLDILELLSMPDCRVRVVTMGINDLNMVSGEESRYGNNLKNVIIEDAENLFDLESGRFMGVIMKNDVVIGGLSPLTLVYSRPDLEAVCPCVLDVRERDLYDSCSLLCRPKSFIRFMVTLANNGLLPRTLTDYVAANINQCDDPAKRDELYHPSMGLDMLERITDQKGNEVKVGDYAIYSETVDNIVCRSGYIIESTKDNRNNNQCAKPLVLSKYNRLNSRYINDYKWRPDCDIIPN